MIYCIVIFPLFYTQFPKPFPFPSHMCPPSLSEHVPLSHVEPMLRHGNYQHGNQFALSFPSTAVSTTASLHNTTCRHQCSPVQPSNQPQTVPVQGPYLLALLGNTSNSGERITFVDRDIPLPHLPHHRHHHHRHRHHHHHHRHHHRLCLRLPLPLPLLTHCGNGHLSRYVRTTLLTSTSADKALLSSIKFRCQNQTLDHSHRQQPHRQRQSLLSLYARLQFFLSSSFSSLRVHVVIQRTTPTSKLQAPSTNRIGERVLVVCPPSPSLCLSSSSIPIPPFVAIVNINNTNNHRQCRTFSKNEGHHSILSLLAPHHTPSPFGEPATAPERAPNPEKPRWMHTTEMTLISPPPPGFRSCASFNLSVQFSVQCWLQCSLQFSVSIFAPLSLSHLFVE